MATATLLDKKGKKSSKQETLNDSVFGLEPNEHILYLAKVRQAANARRGTAHTLTRAEVRGGGAKPWKQKGTGRARAGSSNSPLWNGGGVIFGPRNNVNWKKGMNAKESVLALKSALSMAQKDSKFAVIEEFTIKEGKTKEITEILKTAELCGKKVLLIGKIEDANNELVKRASRNVIDLKFITTAELNVFDLLKADQIIASAAAVKEIEERFAA
ncbi:MAG: 50S ribosomal protein L4 [Candidatus Caenarcaniphilales bacterium]|jgi:large subunit ribosomal protein L4|nr:50S ribosomal protein L4 [Candidatus Caenarcaniphilales bacterium]